MVSDGGLAGAVGVFRTLLGLEEEEEEEKRLCGCSDDDEEEAVDESCEDAADRVDGGGEWESAMEEDLNGAVAAAAAEAEAEAEAAAEAELEE